MEAYASGRDDDERSRSEVIPRGALEKRHRGLDLGVILEEGQHHDVRAEHAQVFVLRISAIEGGSGERRDRARGCRGRGVSGRRRSSDGESRRRAPGCTARARRGRPRRRSRARQCARRARGIRRPGAAPSTRPSLESARESHARRPAKSKGGGGGGASSSATLGAARGAVAADPRVVRSVPLISTRSNAPPARQGRVAQPARAPHPNPSRQPNGRSRDRVRRVLGALTARRASRSSKSAHCRSSVSRTTEGESSRRVRLILPRASRCRVASTRLSRLGSPLDPRLASRPVRGRCHTVCFTATPGYPLHTFPTSGCQPIAAGRRLGWV